MADKMRISDWSSDVCSSDLGRDTTDPESRQGRALSQLTSLPGMLARGAAGEKPRPGGSSRQRWETAGFNSIVTGESDYVPKSWSASGLGGPSRSEAPTSDLHSLMPISYSAFCLTTTPHTQT